MAGKQKPTTNRTIFLLIRIDIYRVPVMIQVRNADAVTTPSLDREFCANLHVGKVYQEYPVAQKTALT